MLLLAILLSLLDLFLFLCFMAGDGDNALRVDDDFDVLLLKKEKKLRSARRPLHTTHTSKAYYAN